jgi:hypothetical protein
MTEGGACGSSFETGIVQVLSISGDSATITQEITYDAQSPNATAAFNTQTGLLKLRGRSEEIAHSHPTAEDEAVFKWNGWRFALQSWRRIPLAAESKVTAQ